MNKLGDRENCQGMEMPATKTCSKCREVKPLDQFYKDKRARDGLYSGCKECSRMSAAIWKAANHERVLTKGREWHSANYERSLASSRAWKKANAERVSQYNAENRASRDSYKRKWRKINPDKHRAYGYRRRARKACAVPQRWLLSECDALACYYCGRGLLGATPEIDHVMPISMGGPADPSNEVMSCQSCNRRKSAKHPLVWIAELVDG